MSADRAILLHVVVRADTQGVMRLSPRLLSWISAVGLIAVFATFSAFEIVDRVQSSQNVQDVRRAEQVRAAYADAKFQITATGAAASLYILLQSPQRRAQFDTQLASARTSLDSLAAIGSPEDKQLVDSILTNQLPKLDVIQRYFKSLELKQSFTEPLPDPSTIDNLNAELTVAENTRDTQADTLFAQYVGHQDARLKVAAVTTGAGLFLVLALLAASRIFGRRDALAQGELKRLRKVALVDSLTDLGNRRAFEERLAELEGPANADNSLSFAIIDVDEFKTINDTWGHERGDQVLRAIAAALRASLPLGATPFRIGGDEFAAVITDVDQSVAFDAMDAFRRAVAHDIAPASVSIGIATVTGTEVDPALLRQQADAALYEAKLRGRNLSIFYHFSPDSAPVFPASKLQAVRHLLAEGALTAVFQPIWSLSPRSILGYEALARPDERYGLAGPQQAFDIAEQFGRAADLDRLCRQKELAAAAALPQGTLLFVNISPYTLTHNTFSAADMRAEFAAAGLKPSQVVLEITERSAVAPEVIGAAARQLRDEGFAIAIDDVGSGSNGIEMLRRVPFDYLKVDRGIVTTAVDGGEGRPAMMAILAFARESNAQVLAEGVETEDCLQLVQDIARGPAHRDGDLIQLVQGFLLGMPTEGFAGDTLAAQAAAA